MDAPAHSAPAPAHSAPAPAHSAPATTSHRGHVLAVPKPLLALRALQFLLAIVVLGLSAYGVHYGSGFWDWDGYSLSLFISLATMIIAAYVLLATLLLPVLYNYWAILALDIFAVVFWLAAFILTAVEAAKFKDRVDGAYNRYYSYYKRDLAPRDTSVSTYRNVFAATAAMGALEFALFVATLAFTAIYLHRHRTSGGHSAPGAHHGPAPAGPLGGPVSAVDAEKAPAHATPATHPAAADSLPVHHPSPDSQPVTMS